MMNILMVHPHDIFSQQEPWTVRIRSIAGEFIKKGHKVRLVYFSLNNTAASCRISSYGEIKIISLSRRLGIINFLKNIFFVVKLAGWADVVHFQKCFYYAAIPSLAAGLAKNKHIHYDWDDWETEIYFDSKGQNHLMGMFLSLLERCMPLLADTVSVSSKRIEKECLKLGMSKSCIFEGHVGADLKRFNPSNNGEQVKRKYKIEIPVVLYAGQIHGGQYVELFIKAASILKARKTNAVFMIVGGGYRLEELKSYSESLNLKNRLIFTGYVEHETVPFYIAAADVCVACFQRNNITECKSPLKIAEYLASGKPIVASNVGEVERMVGDAGILVEPGNEVSLANGIERLLNDSELRDALSLKARTRAETKYNWEDTANSLLKAYNSK